MGNGFGGLIIGALAALAVAAPAQAAFPGENGSIAFTRTDVNGSNIRTMNPDGTGETSLIPSTTDLQIGPSYSPDGSRIVFYGQPITGGNADIWSVNADGTDLEQLTTGAGFNSDPVFSADGSKIFFTSNRDGNREIYSMNTEGSAQTNLTNDPASDGFSGATASPDGSKVVFVSDRLGGNLNLFSMNPDGSGVTRLTATLAADIAPDFSPDGAKIVFASTRDGGTLDSGKKIFTMNADGTGQTQVTDTGNGVDNQTPVFSPDGTKIAFSSTRDGGYQIYTMNVDGSDVTRRTNVPASDFDPGWQPIVQCEAPSASERRRVGDMSAGPVAETAHQRALTRRGDGSGGAPKIAKLMPAEAIAGAAVLVRGDNLGSKRLRATVGGKKAKTSAAKDKSLYVEVPKLKPGKAKLVLRAGKRSDSASLRVAKPFDGEITSELDIANRVTAAIGPDGGELSARGADGTRYRLQIPAAALLADTEISLTPVKRFKGLPFSGADVAGAALGPDGLILASPATLTITGGGDFDPTTVGFGYGDSSGFEASDPGEVGKTLVISVEHFSSHGGAEAAEADIANAFQPIIDKPGNLTRSQIRNTLRLLAIFDERFSATSNATPPDFCKRQPVCRRVIEKAIHSIEAIVVETCSRGKASPTLFALRELADLQTEVSLLTSTSKVATECIEAIGATITKTVTDALAADPLGVFREFELPAGVSGDLDGDQSISPFEMARALVSEFQLLGLSDEAATLDAAAATALGGILDRNLPRCETEERPQAADALRRGHAYAASIGSLESEFLEALDKCGVGVVVTPAFAEVETGETRQFFFQLTNVDDQAAQGGVTWTAGGGTINASGLFTAGGQEGTFTVRATSVLNPNRSATATVEVVDSGC